MEYFSQGSNSYTSPYSYNITRCNARTNLPDMYLTSMDDS